MREEACFIYNGEIYYRIDASDEEIDHDLQSLVEESMYDNSEDSERIMIQAQKYLILRQSQLILKNHCE
jgi:hypothetical protein